MRRRLILAGLTALAAALLGPVAPGLAAAGPPPIRHVFIIVLENESASTTFGANSPAPYLAKTLTSQGAFVPNYYGVGHESNDNYIAMISGQAPNPQTQADCQTFSDFQPDAIGSDGQAVGSGCVFPPDVKTVADQLDAAGLTWRDYNQSMGADPSREAGVCAHPGINQRDPTQSATASDQYATRHNPFVYFHSIIDDTARCDSHVVNLNSLPSDLARASSTPNYVFITPDLCGDGHDATCADPHRPGGYPGIDQFLQTWVPQITASPAFRQQNGLLIINFDESATSDTSSCCGEIAGPNSPSPGIGGPGGGQTGAVLLSPCIRPGTVSSVAYNHYTMLRSVEDFFALSHLGYAQLPGGQSFGSDVFNHPCGTAPVASLRAPPLASRASSQPKIRLAWRATGGSRLRFTLQAEQTSGRGHGWRTLLRNASRRSAVFRGRPGATYAFRLQAADASGLTSTWTTAQTVFPSAPRVPGGKFNGSWPLVSVRGAWTGHAVVGSPGSRLALTYRGASLTLIGSRWPHGGKAIVTVDGVSRTVTVRRGLPRARQALFSRKLKPGRHQLLIKVVQGVLPLEGVAITNRLS
jgi:phosphatidylinositol-3-phosphatase